MKRLAIFLLLTSHFSLLTGILAQGTRPPIDRLSHLSDVTLISPAAGQVLTFNSVTGKWQNAAPSGGFSGLFTDLDFTGSNITSIATRNFSDLQNKPTTIAGYGITDAQPRTMINVKDAPYNAAGDGTTDDTTAIQSALDDLAAAGGGILYFPPGIYLVGGSLQDTSYSNCQLRVPAVDEAEQQVSITLLGAQRPPFQFEPAVSVPLPVDGYSIIKSTLTGATGTAALIGGWGPLVAAQPAENNVQLNVRDMIFQVPANPSLSCLNFANMQSNQINNVLVHCGNVNLYSVTEPTHSNAYGVILPPTNHSTYTRVEGLTVIGYYTGTKLGELTDATGLRYWACLIGLEAPAVNFPSSIRSLGVYEGPYGIKFTGVHPLNITEFHSEIDDGYHAQAWQQPVYHIDDPSNYGKGWINWSTAKAFVGIVDEFYVNGGAGLSTARIGGGEFSLSGGQDAASQFRVTNSNGGGLAQAVFHATNGTNDFYSGILGPGFTAVGDLTSGAGYVLSNSDAGLGLFASSGSIKFGAGGFAKSMELTTAGHLNLAGTWAADATFSVSNNNGSTTAQASFSSSNGTYSTNMGTLGTGFGAVGDLVASEGYLYTDGPSGLLLLANNASGTIKFAAAGLSKTAELTGGTLNVNTGYKIGGASLNFLHLADTPASYSGQSGKVAAVKGTEDGLEFIATSGTGTVTNFSSGNLSPLFTTSVASSTTTPALSFSLSTAAAHSYLGNNTGSTAAPGYHQIDYAELTGTPTIPNAPSDTAWAASWDGVTATAPSKNAIYDWGHTFDTNDNGKVNVLDMGAGIVKTNSAGNVSAATAGTDYLTGNQTITLSGDVTGSGATAITATVANVPTSATVATSLTSVPNNTGGWVEYIVSGSDAATTGQSLVDITGLVTGTLSLNSVYEFEANLLCTTSAVTTGTKYGVNVSVAPTNIVATYWGAVTSTTGAVTTTNANSTADATAFLTTSGATGSVLIKGMFTTGGSGSPVFSVQHLKFTSGTSTVKIGSTLRVRKR